MFKKKPVFTVEENERIVSAIREAEKRTSGEIRIYLEPKNPLVDILERAAFLFFKLKMDQTDQRNAVLLYIAFEHKELALFGDTGIHEKVGNEYWANEVMKMINAFNRDNIAEGIRQCVLNIGEALAMHFPYDRNTDKNELPDDIVFGK